MEIIADREAGLYSFEANGRQILYPSVHRIIAPIVDRQAPEYALNRGRQVHAATALLDGAGDGSGLAWDHLHPVLKPYCEAYLDFKKTMGLNSFSLIEEPLLSHKFRYGGTPDRFTQGRIILDIKAGQPQPWHAIQTAAYAQLIREQSRIRAEPIRQTVHLFPNGRWNLETWKDLSDLKVFMALLELQAWRTRNG